MLKKLVATSDDYSLTILRIALGVVMFPHGAQKVLGWYGGFGFSGTMGFFTSQMGLPSIVAALIILGEFLGALGLITGTLTRVAAFGFVVIQLGAVALVHAKVGFFMNWMGTQQGEGSEYAILAIAMALVLLLKGAGRASVDEVLSRRL